MSSFLNAPSPVAPATGKKKIYPGKKVPSGCIFLTGNTYKRVPVFRDRALSEIFFRELTFYRAKCGFKLYAYVLRPDHFHLLLGFPADRKFAGFLRDFKSAVGRLVVDWARERKQDQLLSRLRLARNPERKKDALYCVLQPRSYARLVTSRLMFKQKLDYIHMNPIGECLVERAIDYPYSSLRSYEQGNGPMTVDRPDFFLD